MAPIDLYYMPASSPCRAVIMLAKHLNIELNLKFLDLMKGEQLKPEFLQINSQHCIPTIVDDDFVLWESRAILQYLANKNNSELYPSDPKSRALVDKMLYFDLGTLYKSLGEFFYPQFLAKQPPDEEKHKLFKNALTALDLFLSNNKYVAGDRLTIADLSILASLTFAEYLFDYDYSEWKNVSEWLKNIKNELPYHKEVNEEPCLALKSSFSQMLEEYSKVSGKQ